MASIVSMSLKNNSRVIRNLGQRFPAIVDHLIENDELKPSVAVSIDGEMATGGVLERVGETSEVHFIPAIGGGK